jgi:hypothetical protein
LGVVIRATPLIAAGTVSVLGGLVIRPVVACIVSSLVAISAYSRRRRAARDGGLDNGTAVRGWGCAAIAMLAPIIPSLMVPLITPRLPPVLHNSSKGSARSNAHSSGQRSGRNSLHGAPAIRVALLPRPALARATLVSMVLLLDDDALVLQHAGRHGHPRLGRLDGDRVRAAGKDGAVPVAIPFAARRRGRGNRGAGKRDRHT